MIQTYITPNILYVLTIYRHDIIVHNTQHKIEAYNKILLCTMDSTQHLVIVLLTLDSQPELLYNKIENVNLLKPHYWPWLINLNYITLLAESST